MKIKQYIIKIIVNEQVKTGSKILSENELIKLFKCSRTPVRNALKELSFEKWIQPHMGKGYFVINFASHMNLFSKDDFDIQKTNLRKYTNNEKKLLNFKIINEIKNKIYYVKEYLKDDEIIIKTLNVVDNDYNFYLTKKEISNSFIQSLINHNIRITHQKGHIIFIQNKKEANVFGWSDEMPVIVTELFNKNKIMEFSLVFIKKEHFKFKKQIIF